MSQHRIPVVILGAGPAGLGSALQLARRPEFAVTVIERQAAVGGNAGSFELDGLRVDYGSHRLHASCRADVLADISSLLGDDLLDRPRHGRIRLLGRWLRFPLKPLDLALRLPPSFLLGVLRDAVMPRRPVDEPPSFAGVLEHNLGSTICRHFYFPYARKIWGLPPEQLDAEQARRRVSAGTLTKMFRRVLTAVPPSPRDPAAGWNEQDASGDADGNQRSAPRPSPLQTSKGRFLYPRRGYGQISEAYHRAAASAGANVRLKTQVAGIEVGAAGVTAVRVCGDNGAERLPAAFVISTIPLPSLIRLCSPAAPPDVLASAEILQYRSMILVYLVLAATRFSPYDAHYFPGPETAITRLSEPKNYGLAKAPGVTVLCAEIPCSPADPCWRASDADLAATVLSALARAGLPVSIPVSRVVTRRLEQAYPIYISNYRRHFDRLDAWAGGVQNLVTIGRQGLFAHDNTHHTLAMAYDAVACLDSKGKLDRERWALCRREFETFVVED